MLQRRLSYTLFLSGVTALVAAILLLLPTQTAAAQCGSQASSCKNCHEVQAKMPVNSDGTGWHESHAFGDFCYICHAGNQQSPDEATAHTGMVPPLADVKASCQMCHAADLQERAQVYATALNVSLDGGSGAAGSTDSGTSTTSGTTSADDFWGGGAATTGDTSTTTTATTAAGANTTGANTTGNTTVSADQAAVCPPASSELVVDDASMVNYVERYDEIVLAKTPTNWGNVALIGMIGLLVLGGGGFVTLNEIRIHTAVGETKKVEGEYPAEVVDMLPALAALKPQGRETLKKILASTRKTDRVLGLIETVLSDENIEE